MISTTTLKTAKINFRLAYAIEYSLVGIPVNAVQEFQHRLVSREPQLHPLLDHYSKILADMRLYWDPLAADCIVMAGIQIIWASLLQHEPNYKAMRPRPGGDRLPTFVRHRDGVSEALSFMTFTKDQCPDMYSYLQAIPDMCIYIDFANDIFRYVVYFIWYTVYQTITCRADSTRMTKLETR
jgi:hypothetical protein